MVRERRTTCRSTSEVGTLTHAVTDGLEQRSVTLLAGEPVLGRDDEDRVTIGDRGAELRRLAGGVVAAFDLPVVHRNDNAMAETTVGSFKNELIRRQGPWRDVDHVEIGTAQWVVWFNTESPHEHLDDFAPEAVERLHYDHKRSLQEAG